MIPKLRKRHRVTWLVLAIMLPVLFILGVSAIPGDEPYNGDLYLFTKAQIGKETDSKDLGYISFNLREASENRRQIEVMVKKPLTAPSNKLVIKGANFGEYYVREILGSQGIYRFNWRDSVEQAYQILLVDQIKQTKLENFNLALK